MRFRVPVRSAVRFAVAHGLSHFTDTIIVNEWPKSGGTWISNLISHARGLPFFDNATPKLVPQVLKGHFLNQGLMPGGVLVWRDGRDVMASWYHHSFFKFKDIPINHARVDAMRNRYGFTDYSDVRANLPKFLEGEFTRPSYPSMTWPQFVERWHRNRRFVHVRYEDFKADTAAALAYTLEAIGHGPVARSRLEAAVDAFDIEKIRARRKKGDDQSAFFVRQGKAGGWRDVYSPEAIEIFDHYAKHAMDVLGYAVSGKPQERTGQSLASAENATQPRHSTLSS